MLYGHITWRALLIPFFMLFVGVLAGPCMPCQASNRRYTPWDQKLSARGVLSPKITNPTNETIWKPASDVVVTWNIHDMPDKSSNAKGTLLLGYLENGSDDEHLNIEHPLASNVDLKNGFVNVKCPKVEPHDKYIVVLIGDSGNRSPPFTIKD